MKVAFHIDQLWFSAPGGIGTYVRELGTALQAPDLAVDLVPFHSRWPTPSPAEPALPLSVEIPAPIRRLYPSWDLFGRPALPTALGETDVVHATNHAAVPPVNPGQKLVVTVHDLAYERFPRAFTRRWRWLYRAGVRAAVNRADALVVPSRSTHDDLVEVGADPARIHVTPLAPCLARSEIEPAQVLTRLRVPTPIVLNVGTLEPRKNQLGLVRAYRRMVASTGLPHTLVLAGPAGWGTGDLIRELAAPGPGRVIRTGSLPAEDLDALYRSADAFAYPSVYEGFGLPVLEAMERGVPTVTSLVSSLPEVAGDAAVLVDPTDEVALADALERLLTDPTFADDLRRRGAEHAGRFSWAATARATVEVYRLVSGAS